MKQFIFFVFAIAFVTMVSLFTIQSERRLHSYNQTHFIQVPHGVYYLPYSDRRCENDCILFGFDGFP